MNTNDILSNSYSGLSNLYGLTGSTTRYSIDPNNTVLMGNLTKHDFFNLSDNQQQILLGKWNAQPDYLKTVTSNDLASAIQDVKQTNPSMVDTASGWLSKLNSPIGFDPVTAASNIGLKLDGQGSILEQIGRAQYGSKFDINNADQMRTVNSTFEQLSKGAVTWGDVGKLGIGLGVTGFNIYNQYKANKLQERQVNDMMRMNHANYRASASAYNNNLRNQQSGRSFEGMSGLAQRQLGKEYQKRKVADDY